MKKTLLILLVIYCLVSVAGFLIGPPDHNAWNELIYLPYPFILYNKCTQCDIPYGYVGDLPRVIECVVLPFQGFYFHSTAPIMNMHKGFSIVTKTCTGTTAGSR